MSPRENPGADRRRDPRATLDWPVRVTLSDGSHEARLRDVSRSGLCFFLDRPIPEMTVLALDLDLPPNERGVEEHVSGSGVVVRCRPLSPRVEHFEVAVFLNELDTAARERLERYVAATS